MAEMYFACAHTVFVGRNNLLRGIALAGWDADPPTRWVVPVRQRVFLNHMSPGCRGGTRNGIRLENFSHG